MLGYKILLGAYTFCLWVMFAMGTYFLVRANTVADCLVAYHPNNTEAEIMYYCMNREFYWNRVMMALMITFLISNVVVSIALCVLCLKLDSDSLSRIYRWR